MVLTRLRERLGVDGRLVVRNAAWLYSDQLIRAVAALAAFSAIARELGPRDFGVLSYAIAFVALFVPVAMLGLDYVVVRDLVRHPQEAGRIVSTTFFLRLGGMVTTMSIGAGFAAASLAPDDPARVPVLIALLSLGALPFLTFDFFFQSRIASRNPSIVRMCVSIAANGTRIGLAWHGAPLAAFAWMLVVEAGFLSGGLAWVFFRAGDRPVGMLAQFDLRIARRLWSAAWPLFIADLLIVLYMRFDQVVLRHLGGAETLGRYAAAVRFSEAGQFLVLAVINSYFPRLVQRHGLGAIEFRSELARFWGRVFWMAVGIALAGTLCAPWLVPIALGADYRSVVPTLIILLWANVFATHVAVRGKWFLLDGKQIWSTALFLAGAVSHLGLLPFVVPRWGVPGAAVSCLIAQIVMSIAMPLALRSTREAGLMALRSPFSAHR